MKPVSGYVCCCQMEGLPSPSVSMETPLKSTLVGEVVSLLSQDHRLSAFWCRLIIWPTACQLRLESSRPEAMRWFVQDIDPKSPNPVQGFLLMCCNTDPLIPGCSWGSRLAPSGFHHTPCSIQILFSRCATIWKRLQGCCYAVSLGFFLTPLSEQQFPFCWILRSLGMGSYWGSSLLIPGWELISVLIKPYSVCFGTN